MPVTPEDSVFASPSVVYKQVGTEAVLLNLETESYFGLNAVGTRCWNLLTTTPRVSDVVDALIEEYDVPPDQLRRDVDALIDELLGRGLLRTSRD